MSLCPHCKKPLNIGLDKQQWKYAKELRSQGYSFRDIEKIFFTLGVKVSIATLSRYFKERGK